MNPKRKTNKPRIARIYVHIDRGCVQAVKSYGLREPIELHIRDHDVQTADNLTGWELFVYRLGAKKRRK